MRFIDSLVSPRSRALFATQIAILGLGVAGLVFIATHTWEQSNASPPASPPTPIVPAPHTVHPGPQWEELTPSQQKILQPLASTWNSLMPERKSKWLAMAHNYPGLAPAEQNKLQSRMVEWAALNPLERERARLNYAKTKKLSADERTADWEAYQALSPEEKQKLAQKSHSKLHGAAIAPKPVAPNTLTVVPLTRRSVEQSNASVAVKPLLDRNTLLPIAANPAPAASAPIPPASTPATSISAPTSKSTPVLILSTD